MARPSGRLKYQRPLPRPYPRPDRPNRLLPPVTPRSRSACRAWGHATPAPNAAHGPGSLHPPHPVGHCATVGSVLPLASPWSKAQSSATSLHSSVSSPASTPVPWSKATRRLKTPPRSRAAASAHAPPGPSLAQRSSSDHSANATTGYSSRTSTRANRRACPRRGFVELTNHHQQFIGRGLDSGREIDNRPVEIIDGDAALGDEEDDLPPSAGRAGRSDDRR